MANETDALELPVGITEKQFLQQIARVEARLNKLAGDAPKKFVAANSNIARSFTRTTSSVGRDAARMRGNLQNVSFQLQDIFVQIAGGQGVTRALSQQLPQLLGGFGALGAGIGVAVAAFPTLISYFSSADEEAGELKDTVSALQSALKLLVEAQQNLATPIDELIEKYGTLAATMREAFAEQLRLGGRELEKQSEALSKAFDDAIDFEQQQGSVEAFEGAVAAIGRALEQGIISQEEYNSRLAELREQMRPTISVVEELEAALANVASSQSLEEYASAWATVRDFVEQNREALERNGVAVDDLLKEANNLAIEFGNTHAASLEIAGALGVATDAASGLSGQMRDVAISAQQAAAAIQLAVGSSSFSPNLNRFNAFGDGTDITRRFGGGGGDEQRQFEQEWAARMAELERAARSGGGGGGSGRRRSSGGGSSRTERPFFENIERDLTNLQREIELIGKSSEEVATLKARWELLDEAKKRGLPINDELSAQIDEQAGKFGRLTAELERNETAFDQYERGLERIGETFADIAFEAESFGDVVSGVLKRIAAEMFSSGVQGLIGNLFPAGSTGGNIIGSIFGGFRAGGGPVQSGRSYIVGEDGPELFSPGMNGSILNASQVSAMGSRGSASNVTYSPSINVSGSADKQTVGMMEAMLQRENDRFMGKWLQAQKQYSDRIA